MHSDSDFGFLTDIANNISLARKFVILDPEASPGKIAALAGATLALGATYWLLRERDDRAAETSEHDPSSSQ